MLAHSYSNCYLLPPLRGTIVVIFIRLSPNSFFLILKFVITLQRHSASNSYLLLPQKSAVIWFLKSVIMVERQSSSRSFLLSPRKGTIIWFTIMDRHGIYSNSHHHTLSNSISKSFHHRFVKNPFMVWDGLDDVLIFCEMMWYWL